MTTSTENLGLVLYDEVDDASKSFLSFRKDMSGTNESNMKKLDEFAGTTNEKIFKLEELLGEGVSVLKTYDEIAVAETDGQTEFPIKLAGFDKATDTVFVVSGRTILAPVEDYNIVGANIVLNEGVPLGRTINIRVQKNVPIGEEGGVSGRVIMDGTLPLSKLEEKVSVQQGGLYINSETTEEDKAEAQEALKEIGGFLPLDGSVPMTGKALGLYNGHGRISADDKTINLFSRDNADLNDYRNLCLQNRTQAEDIADALFLNDKKNGSGQGSFRIFGEHNYKKFVLPLDGSVPMTGKLTTPQLIQDNYAVPTELGEMIDFHLNGSTADFDMRLGVDANGYPIFHDKNMKRYNIFGEHNKPSGSYTGNGSATSREITIPALSTYDLITIQSSTGYIGLVGAWGAVFIDVTSSVAKGYSASVIKRTANGITIAGTENAFNKNGVTYYYGTI